MGANLEFVQLDNLFGGAKVRFLLIVIYGYAMFLFGIFAEKKFKKMI